MSVVEFLFYWNRSSIIEGFYNKTTERSSRFAVGVPFFCDIILSIFSLSIMRDTSATCMTIL